MFTLGSQMKKSLAWLFLLITKAILFLYTISFKITCWLDWGIATGVLDEKALEELHEKLNNR